MSSQSAFDKRYVDPKDQSNVEGLLEHFNLPPKAIAFLRRNKRPVQIVIAVVLITIVALSLYKSYRENRVEDAASALSVAVQEPAGSKLEALTRVAAEYDDTSSGTWANVELGHLAMKEERYGDAANIYGDILKNVDGDNPLYGLTLAGKAQALEAQGNTEESYKAFEELKGVEGYQYTGYSGMARVLESQGEIDKAMGIYGQYLTILSSDENSQGQQAIIEERIARLKTKQ